MSVPLVPEREAETLATLGFDREAEDALCTALEERTGLVLVAGRPHRETRAVAYGLLAELTSLGRGVITIEESVTHVLPGGDQIEAGPESGLTVAQGLARILRAQPDVVFVSEIADVRTAELAAEGAERALVVTTVRAATAWESVRSLCELGVDPGVLAETFRGAVARTVVRRICVACRESYFATPDDLAVLGRPDEEEGRRLLGRGRGCEKCGGTGFDGRETLVDVLPASDELRHWVGNGTQEEELRRLDSRSLRDQVGSLCLDGLTTVAEVKRALG